MVGRLRLAFMIGALLSLAGAALAAARLRAPARAEVVEAPIRGEDAEAIAA